jgi:hypothetical protein
MRLRTGLGAAGVVVAVWWSAMGSLAQAPLPQHPADIRVGDCASLGEVVAPLAPLAVPEGDPLGQSGATPVHQSVTEVPLLLEDILSASYSVAVDASPEQAGTPIACGEIGGTLAEDGSLSIGLQAMNGSMLTGVAAFAPTAAGDGTAVSVLLVDERGGRERADGVADGGDDGIDGVSDGTGAINDGNDGTEAADGVGNVTVMPAPDRARHVDGPDTVDPTAASGGHPGSSFDPGDDGAVDRPERDRAGDRDEDGHRDGGSKGNDEGGARAGEDGRTK